MATPREISKFSEELDRILANGAATRESVEALHDLTGRVEAALDRREEEKRGDG
jgi:hypothetical protein